MSLSFSNSVIKLILPVSLFINSKSDNLVDLNRETIKHHLLYYRNINNTSIIQ